MTLGQSLKLFEPSLFSLFLSIMLPASKDMLWRNKTLCRLLWFSKRFHRGENWVLKMSFKTESWDDQPKVIQQTDGRARITYTMLLFDLVKVKVLPPLTALAHILWQFLPSPDKVSGLSYVFAAGCTYGSFYIKSNISLVRGENLSLEGSKEFFLLMSWHFLGCERKKSAHLVLFVLFSV